MFNFKGVKTLSNDATKVHLNHTNQKIEHVFCPCCFVKDLALLQASGIVSLHLRKKRSCANNVTQTDAAHMRAQIGQHTYISASACGNNHLPSVLCKMIHGNIAAPSVMWRTEFGSDAFRSCFLRGSGC